MSSAGSAIEVLRAFAWLGCTSFGGPVAHIGYFRREFVERRGWLDESAFADLVGLCQLLPGPASSKLGFSLGLLRAGLPGGLAAWLGFTLPSAVLLVLLAEALPRLGASRVGVGLLHGLVLVAVPVVAQAVWVMARSLCPDLRRRAIAAAAAAAVLALPPGAGQVVAIAGGALLGVALCRELRLSLPPALVMPVTTGVGWAAGVAFSLLLGLSLARGGASHFAPFMAFYRSGALVFGGGHVVLPLLHEAVVTPGWTTDSRFMAGYGAAQAVPGPLFTFAAYLGAIMDGPGNFGRGGVGGAAVALAGIFLPGILLQLAVLPFWMRLRAGAFAQGALRGVNAGVVGLLAATLYRPVSTTTLSDLPDVGTAAVALWLLMRWRWPPLAVVGLCALTGILRTLPP